LALGFNSPFRVVAAANFVGTHIALALQCSSQKISNKTNPLKSGEPKDVYMKTTVYCCAKRFLLMFLCGALAIGSIPLGAYAQKKNRPLPSPNPNPEADAVRLLEQATFGPTLKNIEEINKYGMNVWLDNQFLAPVSTYPALTPFDPDSSIGCPTGSPTSCYRDNYTMFPLQKQFFLNALFGEDQLRQRVAFALGQIWVTSGVAIQQPSSMGPFLNVLNAGAFGNFRQLMDDITLNPAMGSYLDMVNNDRRSGGAPPNENYARELLQLFTIGLYKLNQDGTPQFDGQGNPLPTYDQNTVIGFARAFTGWTYAPKPGVPGVAHNPEYFLLPMVAWEPNHDVLSKPLLDGVTAPANQTARQDLTFALDNIFNHPNVPPFISKQLIQHLVTSNPTPAYVSRVAAVFINNGQGVRGDLKAVVRAILTDTEARGSVKDPLALPNYGHLREPVLYVTNVLRAFKASSDGTNLDAQGRNMGQNLFYSPSVFNYYRPNYQVPGTGILGPEFSIQTTSAALAHANFANTIVYSQINSADTGGTATRLDLSSWQTLAQSDTTGVALVNELNRILLHGTMSAQMKNSILQAITTIPTSDSQFAMKRARSAIYLVITSSQYLVQR
jgi:uncharacterized protein (DUF1800 family)